MEGEKAVPPFNARAAGVILLAVLVVLVLAGAVLNSVLDYLRHTSWTFLRNASELELRGTRLVILSLLDPFVMFGATLLLLRKYFPSENFRKIVSRFGLTLAVPFKLGLVSFLIGVVYVLFFRKILMTIFPPGEFAAPHPANAAASVAIWAQLMFAISAVTLVPIVEEFFFRGVLYQGFSAKWNKVIAATFVSIVFILFHPDSLGTGYWVTHLSLYAIPFIFIVAREKTGSLTSPILIHSGFNFGVIFIP